MGIDLDSGYGLCVLAGSAGLWSLFQSLGLSNRGIAPQIQKFAIAVAVILTLGFSAVPLAVLVGIIG